MKNIAKGFLAFVLVLLLASLMYVHFRRDRLSQRVLNVLRSELATDLQVGDFELDLLTSFPRIRIDMHDAVLQGKGGSTLLQAGELQLRMSLFSAFSDEIRFKSLSLKEGVIHIERLKDGTLSLAVLDSTGQSETTGPGLHFNKVTLENVAIQYSDPKADQEYHIYFHEGLLTGSFEHQLLEFDISGDVRYDKARISKMVYLNGAEGNLKGNIALDLDHQLYTFEELALAIGEQDYEVDGTVRVVENHQNIDLVIRQTEGDMRSFLSLLPASYRKDLPFKQFEGAFTAEGFIKGRLNSVESPHIHFDLQLDDASLESPHAKGTIHDIAIHGAIDNGAFRRLSSAQLDLPVIKGKAYGQKFDASLQVTDFTDPVFTGTFDGSLPASFLLDYTGAIDSVQKISGAMHFSDVHIGPLRVEQMDFTDVRLFRGRCVLANIELTKGKARYQIPDGVLDMTGDSMHISDLTLKMDRDEIRFNGWLMEIGDAMEGNDMAYLRYDLALKAGSVHLSKWIPSLATGAPQEMQPQVRPVSLTTTSVVRLPEGTLTFSADEIYYREIIARKLAGTAMTQTHAVEFGAEGEVAGGVLKTSGTLTIENGYQLHLQTEGERIDIQDCFTQCENFGQDVLRADHLRGKGDVKIIADVPWDREGRLQSDRIQVFAGMTLRDGELVQFDMLEQFSNYVHVEDLRRIRFERIDNFIEVRNGNVYIPAMFIQSNAVNLVVNGVHRLDNHILYNIKVNAGQVVTAKMKKHNPKLTPLPARKNGQFNLHFTIAGTMEEYTYDFNKRAAESSFAQSEELRERIREQLRAAFGEAVDLIEPPEWETIPEYDLEQKGEDVFLDEID